MTLSRRLYIIKKNCLQKSVFFVYDAQTCLREEGDMDKRQEWEKSFHKCRCFLGSDDMKIL